ncbi:hypothetical protein [Parathalassolituus penaei]|uniref:Uncharacterized protein n=1 Tax=Parathalassolituus penaei TaxID=2997323 RepID=A0A9X3EG85_9GAMM|nr:hypothetical protein [Parathalassolituus penaei]MCY0963721.1 hypothetical protein [Parathalassolituus penaei]
MIDNFHFHKAILPGKTSADGELCVFFWLTCALILRPKRQTIELHGLTLTASGKTRNGSGNTGKFLQRSLGELDFKWANKRRKESVAERCSLMVMCQPCLRLAPLSALISSRRVAG